MNMVWKHAIGLALSLSALAVGAPATAQEPPAMVKASDAAGLLKLLKQSGYKATLVPREDSEDNVSIEIGTLDLVSSVILADCEEAVPDFCETITFSTGWDRITPMSAEAVAAANRNYKYVSVWLDDDGDPVLQWSILTRDEGIAAPLFLNALQRYLEVANAFHDVVFENDGDAEPEADQLVEDAEVTT